MLVVKQVQEPKDHRLVHSRFHTGQFIVSKQEDPKLQVTIKAIKCIPYREYCLVTFRTVIFAPIISNSNCQSRLAEGDMIRLLIPPEIIRTIVVPIPAAPFTLTGTLLFSY